MISLMAGAHADEPVGPLNLVCLLKAIQQGLIPQDRFKVAHFDAEMQLVRGDLLGAIQALDESLGVVHPHWKTWVQTQVEAWGQLWRSLSDEGLESLTQSTWAIVGHINPQGADANRTWWRQYLESQLDFLDGEFEEQTQAQLRALPWFLKLKERELPGRDIEFGFPYLHELAGEIPSDQRPEPWQVTQFWRDLRESDAGELSHQSLHLSFHGMGYSGGPWFLLDQSWDQQGRLDQLKASITQTVESSPYEFHDSQRQGEKGFYRLGQGFCTRPNASAMREHFQSLGEPEVAQRFRPSSMECFRELYPGAMTAVTEMPLYVLSGVGRSIGPPDLRAEFYKLKRSEWELELSLARETDTAVYEQVIQEAWDEGVRLMPLSDQMEFQRLLLLESIKCLVSQ